MAKSQLLSFIDQNKKNYAAQEAWLAAGLLVAAIFCLIGWIREKSLEKQRIEPCGPANLADARSRSTQRTKNVVRNQE